MCFYYLFEEVIEISTNGRKYFSDFWNVIDIVILGLSFWIVGFRFYRTYELNRLLGNLAQNWQAHNSDSYPDFEFISYVQIYYVYCCAFLVFFAWVKLFKYLSFSDTMMELQGTLIRCFTDIIGFIIMFGLVMLAFTMLGHMVFGNYIYKFSTMSQRLEIAI